MNVVCVNVGTKYQKEYVDRLFNMVERNTSQEVNFYVYTDNKEVYNNDYNVIEHEGQDAGWWCKLSLFKPGLLPDERFLYFDLDVVIVDSIDSLDDGKGFKIIRDFIRPDAGILPGKEYNSSVMAFTPSHCSGIWTHWSSRRQKWLDMVESCHFFGDQNIISNYLNYYPDFCRPFEDKYIWSFKKGWQRGKHAGDRSDWFGKTIPSKGKVCVFHGNPSPSELIGTKKCPKWVEDNWK